MEITDSITRLNGVSAYTAQLSLGKAASDTADASGQQDTASSPDLAVVNTKEASPKNFGIKLGKLGIRYVSEEPEVDYDAVAEEALKHAERTQAAAYKSEMEIALLLNELHTDGTQGQAGEGADVSPLQAHYGSKAYSRMTQNNADDPGKGVLLGIA